MSYQNSDSSGVMADIRQEVNQLRNSINSELAPKFLESYLKRAKKSYRSVVETKSGKKRVQKHF